MFNNNNDDNKNNINNNQRKKDKNYKVDYIFTKSEQKYIS